ncbi:MAG: peptide MFS transporter [Planctomycetota bacterium]
MNESKDPNAPMGQITPDQQGELIAQQGTQPPSNLTPPGEFPTRQPRGLWVLFVTEMWERFSYYGMRALLVLYLAHTSVKMTVGTDGADPGQGFGWSKAEASVLYGIYTFMVYVTSIFGGIAADRYLGTHRSMIWGGWIIALGHVCLAMTELFGIPDGEVVSPQTAPGALFMFLLGLALIIIGTGFFKPCVSVMVGQLYGEGDPRRDSGFTYYYMGINLGAMLSSFVAGTLGEKVGWHWGFGAAAVGMVAGLISYQLLRPKFLAGIGDAPEGAWKGRRPLEFLLIALGLCAIPFVPLALYMTDALDPITSVWSRLTGTLGQYGTAAAFAGVLLVACGVFLAAQMPKERGRIAVILVLAFIGNIFFWTAFEQAGTSMNFFAKDNTDRTLWGLWERDGGFPATWYQSINSLTIIICAPVFSWLWVWLDRKRKNPSSPMKFAIGLWLLGLAFLAMVFGALDAKDGLAAPHWLLITYVVYTWGELCLSPVGLSLVTKLAPKRLQSLMMGVWFFSFALSNLCAGLVAAASEDFQPQQQPDGTILPPERDLWLGGLADFYLMLVIVPIAAGFVIFAISPVLRKWMGDVK